MEDPAPALKCVGFKKTLQCDPSGPRDITNDHDCAYTVSSEESGFCECGDFEKIPNNVFAAVKCIHPPFTCDVMCLKFAVISGKSIEYQGATLTPEEANKTLAGEQENPYELGVAKKAEDPPPIGAAVKAFAKQKAEELEKLTKDVNTKAEKANAEVEEMMKQNSRAWEDLHNTAKALRFPGGEPVWKGLANAAKEMTKSGQKIQKVVKDVLPWDALAGPPPFP